MSEITLETAINGKINRFSFYVNLFRNTFVLNAIKDTFFNQDNKNSNQCIINSFVKKEFNETFDDIDETIFYQSSFLYVNEEINKFIYNTRYNMMLNIDNNFSAMALFLHVFCLPNVDNGKVFIIKNNNLNLLVDALKYARHNNLFNISGYYDDAKQLDDFILLFDNNKLTEDVVLMSDFYIEEDDNVVVHDFSVYGYDNVIDLLKCHKFNNYIDTFKTDLIDCCDLNDVMSSYFSHLDFLNKDVSYEFKSKLNYIENNFDNVFLTTELLNIHFVYNDAFSLKTTN